jgi:repressor LexA
MKLKELRNLKGVSQAELGKALDVERSTVCQWEKGNRSPDYMTLCKIADFFGVTVDYLLGRENELAIKNQIDVGELEMYPIPLVGKVVAGMPIECEEYIEGYVYINHRPKEEYFALKVFGDSMINAGIPDGAILIVHKQSYAENGNIVVAFLNGEQTVKYLKYSEDDMYLVPANNNYLPIHIKKTDEFLILGKVVEIRINL